MELRDKYQGPFNVTEDVTLHGMVTGDASVAAGATLRLHGMVTGDLHVREGATAYVFGTVAGRVINQGQVEVHGIVDGIATDGAGRTTVEPGAIVGGKRA